MSALQTTPEQLNTLLQSLSRNTRDFKISGTPTRSITACSDITGTDSNSAGVFTNHSVECRVDNGVVEATFYTNFPKDFHKMEVTYGQFHKILYAADAVIQDGWNATRVYQALEYKWGDDNSYVKFSLGFVSLTFTLDGVTPPSSNEQTVINFYDNNNHLIPYVSGTRIEISDEPRSFYSVDLTFDNGQTQTYTSAHQYTIDALGTRVKVLGNAAIVQRILLSETAYFENGYGSFNSLVYYEDTGESWCIVISGSALLFFTTATIPNWATVSYTIRQRDVNVANLMVSASSDDISNLDSAINGMDSQPVYKVKIGSYEKTIKVFDNFGYNSENYTCLGNKGFCLPDVSDHNDNWGFAIRWSEQSLQVLFATTESLPTEDIEVTFILDNTFSHGQSEPYEIEISNVSASNIRYIKQALLDNPQIYVALKMTYTENISDLTDMFNGCYNLVSIDKLPNGVTNLTRCFKDTYSMETAPEFPDSVINITECFKNSNVINIPLIPAVTSYNGAFDYCRFIQNIAFWDYIPQQNLTSLFRCCAIWRVDSLSIGLSTGEQITQLKTLLLDRRQTLNTDLAPVTIDRAVFYPAYSPNMQIPISELEDTLKGFPANTISNPYIIDVTELTDAETNFSNAEGFAPSVLADAITKGGRYVRLVESADSVSSEYFIYGLADPNSQTQYLVGVDFSNCTTIKSMSMCFAMCTHLTTVVLPPSLRDNPSAIVSGDNMSAARNLALYGTFMGCSALSTVTGIPNNIEMLVYTFGDSGITQAPNIPNSVKYMLQTFQNCENLTSISNLPTSLQLMTYCFAGCSHLTSVPSTINLNPLDNQFLIFGKDSSVVINYAFDGCERLTTSVTFTGSITEMCATFRDCALITSVGPIPSAVTSMEECFNGCHSLVTMPTIPNGVTNLESCFEQCNSLPSMTVLPKSVKNMTRAFKGCSALTSINIPTEVENLEETFYGTAITVVPPIPESCSSLNQTFRNCQNLLTVKNIPKTVTNMQSSFAYCYSLETVEMWDAPHSLLYSDAFSNCSNLASVTPKNLYSYTSLRATVFSSNKSVVQWNGFDVPFEDFHYYLDKLPNNNSAQSIDDEHSPRITELLAANCVGADTAVEGSIQYELQNTSNKKFKITIDEDCLEETVTSFSKCFKGCTNVYELEIPDSIETLTSMCEGCTNLSNISTLSDNVRSLNSAFKGCPNLTSIERMPAGVNDLTSAFETSSNANLDIGEWLLPLASMTTYPMQDAFKNRTGTIGLSKRKLSTSSKRWYLVKFEVDTTTSPYSCVYSVYDLDNNLVKSDSFPISTATMNLSGKIDELVISGDLTSAKIQKAINYRTQFTSKTALDPANPNFVFWAKDPNHVVTNLLYNYAKPTVISSDTTIALVSHDTKFSITGTDTALVLTAGSFAGIKVEAINIGSNNVTLNGNTIESGDRMVLVWNGTSWEEAETGGGGGGGVVQTRIATEAPLNPVSGDIWVE